MTYKINNIKVIIFLNGTDKNVYILSECEISTFLNQNCTSCKLECRKLGFFYFYNGCAKIESKIQCLCCILTPFRRSTTTKRTINENYKSTTIYNGNFTSIKHHQSFFMNKSTQQTVL